MPFESLNSLHVYCIHGHFCTVIPKHFQEVRKIITAKTIKNEAPRVHCTIYYCWWKSCTSWYGKNPIIYRVSYMLGGAGFLPSTVLLMQLVWFCVIHFAAVQGPSHWLQLSGYFRGPLALSVGAFMHHCWTCMLQPIAVDVPCIPE